MPKPLFDYPPKIRKVNYATNATKPANASLRRVTKTPASFPAVDAVSKLLYLVQNDIGQRKPMPMRERKAALNRFIVQFDERILRV